jgi:hypothetical protein
MSEGDLADKALIGLGSAAGVEGRSLLKPGSPIGVAGYVADFVGSTAGDIAG